MLIERDINLEDLKQPAPPGLTKAEEKVGNTNYSINKRAHIPSCPLI
jgi:hypothetical protein